MYLFNTSVAQGCNSFNRIQFKGPKNRWVVFEASYKTEALNLGCTFNNLENFKESHCPGYNSDQWNKNLLGGGHKHWYLSSLGDFNVHTPLFKKLLDPSS